MTRRGLLGLAAGSIAAELAWPVLASAAVSGATSLRWPRAPLRPADAQRVNDAQFMPGAQLFEWHRELDAVGLWVTGSPPHEHYIDVLRERLGKAGV